MTVNICPTIVTNFDGKEVLFIESHWRKTDVRGRTVEVSEGVWMVRSKNESRTRTKGNWKRKGSFQREEIIDGVTL